MPDDAVRDTLLRAATILQLFRALVLTESPEQKALVELHLVRLINDLSDTDGGFILVESGEQTLQEATRLRDFPALQRAVEQAQAHGIIYQAGITAAPLYVHGKIA